MEEYLDSLKHYLAYAERLFTDATVIWKGGGWAMIGIAIIALTMFSVGVRVRFDLRAKGFLSVPERRWRRWIDHRAEREGAVGELLDFVTGASTLKDMSASFEQLRTTELSTFERDLRVMKTCVAAAPLVGLLGTVTGMLFTFEGLASGSGGEKTMGMIAAGISEALITTETGLVVALPGLFFQATLARKVERYRAFLAHVETVCAQTLYRQTRKQAEARVQVAARRRIAEAVLRRLQSSPKPAADVTQPLPN